MLYIYIYIYMYMFDQDGAEAIVNGVRKHVESKLESLRDGRNEPRHALSFWPAWAFHACIYAIEVESRASRW